MTKPDLFQKIAANDRDCVLWLSSFDAWYSTARSFIASKQTNPKAFIAILADLNMVCSLPFYSRNAAVLYLPVVTAMLGLEYAEARPNWSSVLLSVAILKHGPVSGRAFAEDIVAVLSEPVIDPSQKAV